MKITLIGGGNGVSQLFLGLKKIFNDINIVVAVTDCGRSTGVTRDLFDMPAPGDIRNTILNLVNKDDFNNDIFQYRFESEQYDQYNGMALGNLVLGALYNKYGDLEKAVEEFRKLVACKYTVLPVSNYNTQLCAELEDGEIVVKETEVRRENKPRIKQVFLENMSSYATESAVNLIRESDLVILGPGCLYTSVIACLLFRGIPEAINQSNSKVVYVSNSTTQPGQTDDYTWIDHVKEIKRYAGKLDYVIANSVVDISDSKLMYYTDQGLNPIVPTEEELEEVKQMGAEMVLADILEDIQQKRVIWNKKDTIRHDSDKVAKLVKDVVDKIS